VTVDYHPDFVLRRRGPLSIYLEQSLANDAGFRMMADADGFFDLPDCRIVKDQRKIKVARVKIEVGGKPTRVYLKRYNAFSWRYRAFSLFRSSGAVRSLKGAAILTESSIRTARPLAAMESRSWGMLDKSFFVSQEIEQAKTVDAYWRDELQPLKAAGSLQKRQFLNGLGELFRFLHERGVYHNDLKDANILVGSSFAGAADQFYLLDLEGIRRYRRLGRRRKIKNLVQLNRTLGKYVRLTDKARFLRSYLNGSLFSRTEKRDLISKVSKQSSRLDRLRAVRVSNVKIKGRAVHER
jgi:hypothetical protein